MNQKQLANVLIKVFGLSLCVQSVTHLLTSGISLLSTLAQGRLYGGSLYVWLSPLVGVVIGGIGIIFIALSKTIVDSLFKEE